ncbi:MAG TPA: hypothetical protein VG435_03410 [Acidimicrobiales bacterium]|nr:hypothetical protein [Acidimicrobiales bacterium]
MGLSGERAALARMGREWLLHGHLQDRVGVPLWLGRGGRQGMEQLAIDEWMTASPVYSKRMQRLLRFGPAGGGGDGVPDIFKNLQLDIGAPHGFLDFHYRVDDDRHGQFWLAHCGALMDVEPMGTDFVVGMCHTIEDPTFDATAGATNRYARVRPRHRPPRVPANRHPHCHWTVTVGQAGDWPPAEVHEDLAEMETSPLAQLPIPSIGDVADAGGGGQVDYAGPFDPDFRLEQMAATTLAAILDEFAHQAHLLLRAYALAVGRRIGEDDATRMGHRVVVGQAALTAERLLRLPDAPGGGAAERAAWLFQNHPLFHPRALTDLTVDTDRNRVRLAVRGGHALEHPDPFTAWAMIDRFGPEPIAEIARAADRRATVADDRSVPGEQVAWTIGFDGPPIPEPTELALARFSTGATFDLEAPRPAVRP